MASSTIETTTIEIFFAFASSSFLPHTFFTPINLKLDDDNFFIWKHQVLATIRELKLYHFLDNSSTPPQFLNVEDTTAQRMNPAFTNHEQQDQLLVTWLLASMSNSILTKMVGLDSTHQIWSKLHVYYASQTCARVKQLRFQLRNPKRDRSITVFLFFFLISRRP